jgi:hypothetical protein
MDTLGAEDLLLLLLDDEKGAVTSAVPVQTVLGGALLVELAMSEHAVVEKTSAWRTAKVKPVDGVPPPEDPILADALATIAEKERPASSLVDRLGKGLRDVLADRLVQRGLLEKREDKVLGLFPRTRWPAADSAHEDDVRRRLQATLVQGAEPDERTAALAALLHAVDRAHQTVDRGPVPAKEVRQRAKALAEGQWGAKAVRDAVAAAMAATTAATVAATSAATSGSS